MKHNLFGDPIPFGVTEIQEALEEKGMSEDLFAIIEFNEVDGDFTGFTAEIHDNDEPDNSFTTMGYASRADLVNDLYSVGITDVQSY